MLIFRVALAFSEHGLKMPVLANTLFGPQFHFNQNFEQRICRSPRFLCDTVLDNLFHMVACFYTEEQCSAKQSEHSFAKSEPSAQAHNHGAQWCESPHGKCVGHS